MSFLLPSPPPSTLTIYGPTNPFETHGQVYYVLKKQVKEGSPSRDGAYCSPLTTQVFDTGIVFSWDGAVESLPAKDTGVPIALAVTFGSRQLTIVGRYHDKFVVVYSTL